VTRSGRPSRAIRGVRRASTRRSRALRARRDGKPVDPDVTFPTVEDGLLGMKFIEAAVQSSKKGAVWTKV
jgi:hypothetical protein